MSQSDFGTPLGLTRDAAGRIWMAASRGLFGLHGRSWRRAAHDLPHLNAVLATDAWLFVAGPGLARSADAGASWQMCWLDAIDAPITCLLASPRHERDRVMLAGSAGDGVLRSIDGGRHWEASNFGLADTEVLALAAPPEWGAREPAFAATAAGVCRSPNGGRGWQRCEASPPGVVQSLAVSPRYATDATVFAGTEEDGLYGSSDAGRSWKRLRGVGGAINCLLWTERALFAGTADSVCSSADLGRTWRVLAKSESPVLCLLDREGELLAGLDGQVRRLRLD